MIMMDEKKDQQETTTSIEEGEKLEHDTAEEFGEPLKDEK